jgi:hypothetical protein
MVDRMDVESRIELFIVVAERPGLILGWMLIGFVNGIGFKHGIIESYIS